MKRRLLILIFIIVTTFSYAQCVNNFMFVTYNMPNTSNNSVESNCIFIPFWGVIDGQYPDEYSVWNNVQVGSLYEFSSSINTDWITIRSGSFNGPVVGFGQTDLIFTATQPGPYYIHINSDEFCNTFGGCRDIEMELISALPVELIYFEPIYKDGVVVMNWSTASERNNSHFVIDRSYDGYIWNEVYTIDGAGTTTEKQDYEQIDKNISSGIIYYRLKQVDYDGTVSIEAIRSVMVEKRKVLKVINLLGQEVTKEYDGIRIIIYSNGDQVKTYK